MPPESPHPAPDLAGKDLAIQIRIGPDGRLYFHDLTVDLLPVALALCPGDAALQRRASIAARFDKEGTR